MCQLVWFDGLEWRGLGGLTVDFKIAFPGFGVLLDLLKYVVSVAVAHGFGGALIAFVGWVKGKLVCFRC